jgi:hypothetical protein
MTTVSHVLLNGIVNPPEIITLINIPANSEECIWLDGGRKVLAIAEPDVVSEARKSVLLFLREDTISELLNLLSDDAELLDALLHSAHERGELIITEAMHCSDIKVSSCGNHKTVRTNQTEEAHHNLEPLGAVVAIDDADLRHTLTNKTAVFVLGLDKVYLMHSVTALALTNVADCPSRVDCLLEELSGVDEAVAI